MRDFSFVKYLRNSLHANYAMEFLSGMPIGLYDNSRPFLTQLVAKEIGNLRNVRRNNSRVTFNDKVKELRSLLSALRIILYNEQRRGAQGGIIEYHSYVTKILGQQSNLGIVQDARSFVESWTGVELPAAETLMEDIRNMLEEIDNIMQFKEMEDLMIANIPLQKVIRDQTDNMIANIIRKAESEKYELSPNIESEVERLEQITEFLNFVRNWLTRIKVSVKNYGKDEDNPTPPEDGEDITPLDDSENLGRDGDGRFSDCGKNDNNPFDDSHDLGRDKGRDRDRDGRFRDFGNNDDVEEIDD